MRAMILASLLLGGCMTYDCGPGGCPTAPELAELFDCRAPCAAGAVEDRVCSGDADEAAEELLARVEVDGCELVAPVICRGHKVPCYG